MIRLGLENKYNEEVSRSRKEMDELVLKQKAQIEALTASLNAKTVECEELKAEVKALKPKEEECAQLKEYISVLDTCRTDKEMTDKLQTALADIVALKRQVQYLSLFAPKKSERQKSSVETSQSEKEKDESDVPDNSSEGTAEGTKNKAKQKSEIKECKKATHNGNNGARINKHEYDDIKTETIKQEPVLSTGIDISQLDFIGTKTVVKYSANTKVEVTRYEYLVNMYKDKKTGIIYSGKTPETPLRGSAFTSAFITLLICLKYAAHISVSTIQKMFRSSNFEISDRTLNGLINKTTASQFFRNLDKVFQLEILKSSYIIMDETYAKAKTNIAKATQQFVMQFYI